MTPRLVVRLLGGFAVLLDGRRLTDLDTPTLQSLLSFLVLHPGRPNPRAQIAAHLWPEASRPHAQGSLRKALHQLRRRLPDPDALITIGRRDVTWVGAALCAVDAHEVASLVALPPDAERLSAVVARYQGDLLPECFDAWVEAPRWQLREGVEAYLLRAARQLMRDGELAAARAGLVQLVAMDPLREDAYLALMEAHTLGGDRAAALKIYETCAKTLRRELGEAPGEGLQRMRAELLAEGASELGQGRVGGEVDPEAQWKILLERYDTCALKGDRPAALQALAQLEALTVGSGDDLKLLKLRNLRAAASFASGDFVAAAAEARRARRLLAHVDAPAKAAQTWRILSLAQAQLTGQLESSLQGLSRALALADEAGSPDLRAAVLSDLSPFHVLSGREEDGRAALQEALAISRRHSLPRREAICLYRLARTQAQLGQYAQALEAVAAGRALNEDLGNVQLASYLCLAATLAQWGLHRPGEALAESEAGVERAREAQDRSVEGDLLQLQGMMLTSLGQPERALERLERAHALSRQLEHDLFRTARLAEMCRALLARGETRRGLTMLEQGMAALTGGERFDVLGELHRARGEALARVGQGDEAAAAFTEAIRYFEKAGAQDDRLGCLVSLAELAQAGGEARRAQRLLAEPIEALRSGGASAAWSIRAAEAWARQCADQGQGDEAQAWAQRAQALRQALDVWLEDGGG